MNALPALTAILWASASGAGAATIYALGESGGNLFSFDSGAPGIVVNNRSITGVPAGQSVRAIDFRPSDGKLYMLTTGATTSDARLFTLNLNTAAATLVGSLTLTGATGIRHSMDWNPVTGQLLVVSSASRTQFWVNPADLTVTAAATLPSGTQFSDVAFDNNFTGSASTSQYLFDYADDSLSRTTVPGAGTLIPIGFPFAPSFTNASSQGFDIAADGTAYFNTDMFDGPLAGTGEHLFTFNLTNGTSTDLGAIGLPVLDISVQPVPEPSAAMLTALAFLPRRRRSRN